MAASSSARTVSSATAAPAQIEVVQLRLWLESRLGNRSHAPRQTRRRPVASLTG